MKIQNSIGGAYFLGTDDPMVGSVSATVKLPLEEGVSSRDAHRLLRESVQAHADRYDVELDWATSQLRKTDRQMTVSVGVVQGCEVPLRLAITQPGRAWTGDSRQD